MDPSKLSQASQNITNFINTSFNPDDIIQDIKKALSKLSTTVQNKLVQQPRNKTSKGEATT